jgi:hypothetical protein
MVDDINVPAQFLKQLGDEVDSPTPTLRVRYEGVFEYNHNYTRADITLTNHTEFQIEPNQFKTLRFTLSVISNLPAVSLIYPSSLLFREGLSCVITPIPTNDMSLYVILHNHCNTTKTFPLYRLVFYCNTVLAKT